MQRVWKSLRPIITIRGEISQRQGQIIFVLALITIASVYSALAYSDTDKILPTWDKLWIGVGKVITDPATGDHYLWEDTFASFGRILPAIGLSSLIGIIIGMYMGVYGAAEAFLSRILTFLGNIPANALMVVFFSYFGFGLKMYIAVIISGTVSMIALSVYEAVKAIGSEEIYQLKMQGASSSEIVWSVLFWQVLPHILTAVRATFGPALIYTIAAEWISASDGFGYRIMMFKRSARMELIFPYVAYLGLLGIFTQTVFKFAERILCPWYEKGDK